MRELLGSLLGLITVLTLARRRHDQVDKQHHTVTRYDDLDKGRHAPPITVVSELHIPPALMEHYTTSQEQQERRDRWSLRLQVFTLAAVFFGSYVAYRQLAAMNSTLTEAVTLNQLTRDAVQAARDSAVAAKKSADAADVSAKAADTQAHAAVSQAVAAGATVRLTERQMADAATARREEQRARLLFTIKVWGDPTDDGSHLVVMELQNNGKTNATRTRYRTIGGVLDHPPTLADIDGPLMEARPWTPIADVFPNQPNRELRTNGLMSADELSAFRAKKARHSFLVELQYCDPFQQRYWIRSCTHRGVGEKVVSHCGATTGEGDDSECQPSQ